MTDLGGQFDSAALAHQHIGAVAELCGRDQWVGWKPVDRGGPKPTKIPVNAKNGRAGSSTDPTTWTSHDAARAAEQSFGVAGVGFVLSPDDDYTGIDLDSCRDPSTGSLANWAQDIIDLGETYAEVSPSGTGLRLFARGKVASATFSRVAGVEIYGTARFLTVTGEHVEGTPDEIRPAPRTIQALLARKEALDPEKKLPIATAPVTLGAPVGERERTWAQIALAETATELGKTGSGGRNHALNAAAYRLGRIVARGWLKQSEVVAALEDACKRNGVWKEDGPRTCRGSINSGLKSGLTSPHEDLEDRPQDVEAERMGDQIAAVLEARDSNPVPDSLAVRHDPETGEIIKSAKPAAGAAVPPVDPVKITPYPWCDPATIPPREWLFGQHLIRKFVAVTGAPGGVGKTSLLCAEALSMVSGRALLQGVAPAQPLNVWLWNGEDPLEEIYRRVAAAAKYYGITQADCEGQLFVDSGRVTKIVIAETNGSRLIITRPIVDAVKQKIRECKIDVLVIDPFVSSHRVPENDNTLIDAVAREWATIADETDCAIELVHHVRKIGDAEVTVEALRGGSALVSACRSARVLNQMSKEEGEKAGVENRRAFFRVDFGKSNMSLVSGKALWHQMKSVDLENRGPFRDGDSVGVVADWKWPDPLDAVTAKDLAAVQVCIARGEWRESVQAKDWAGHAVAEVLGLDATDNQHKEKIKGLLKIWLKNGALVVVRHADKNGDMRPFIEVPKHDDDAE